MNVALKNLASHLSEAKAEDDDPIRTLVEKLGDSFTKVIEIELTAEPEGVYRFKQVQLSSFDIEDYGKYLYRGGGTSGIGVTLTCKLGKPNPKDKKPKTPKKYATTALQKKVAAYLKTMGENAEVESTSEFGKATFAALKVDEEKVLHEITMLAEQITPTNENSIVTLVVVGPKARKYPRDIAPLKDFFLQCVNPETREQKGMSSVGEDAVCSCCGKQSKNVFCQPQTLPYFTFDKPGFITGGFFKEDEVQEKAWRNFPLCSECVLDVRRGFKAVEQSLRFRLSKTNYLLIPSFANWESRDARAIVDTLAALSKNALTDINAQRDQEEIFIHRLSKEDNTASFSFLFYRKKQSRLEILSTLDNVLPSRMSEIAEAMDRADNQPLLSNFGDWAKAAKIGPIKVNFGLLRDLYQPRLKMKGDPPVSHFLRAVQRVVYAQPFDTREFFDTSMRYVRRDLREQQGAGREPWLALSTHRCLALAFWLFHLGLLRLAPGKEDPSGFIGEHMTDYPELNAQDLNSRFDQFFQTFSGLFAREEQTACYLMGVLCAQVLSEQRKRFDYRQPFFRNLKDLKLDEAEMRGLLPKLKSKLVEYEIDHFYWELEKAIAERFRKAGAPWRLINSEVNFFFTLGLCEAPLFKAKSAKQTD